MPKEPLSRLLAGEGITCHAALAYNACRILHPGMVARLSPFAPKTAILFLVPYYAGETVNLSRYAAAGDYHAYMQGLFTRLTPALERETGYTFHGFADQSPIDERHAAAVAGLGMLGKNGLLIHETYGSFVFIGEWLTDAPPESLGAVAPVTPRSCMGCGACKNACPSGCLRGESTLCLSSVTQKKGELNAGEAALLLQGNLIWGCDVCQEICPYNQRMIREKQYTPITYFHNDRITRLTREMLDAMDADAFAARAFSFRGRAPLERNLALLDKK